MKTLKRLMIILAIFSSMQMYGQRKVALHSNGTTTLFGGNSPYEDAYNAAIDGDTIYLPGGQFSAPHISKRLVVFGVGHNPDSSAVFGETIINGFYFYTGSAKSHFEGLKITSGLTYGGVADSILIKRCNINGVLNMGTYASTGTQIIENVIIGSVTGANAINTVIANNIIKKNTNNALYGLKNNTWIYNNIIVGSGRYVSYVHYFVMSGITDCLFENNIILNEASGTSYKLENVIDNTTSNNTFRNNVFNGDTVDLVNNWENNYWDVPTNTIFNNYTGLTFDYTEDFHLVSPSTYLGTTGNEVGVYGGYNPIKVGAIPVNPHIRFKSISTQTNAAGEINVNISVGAQDN